MSPKNAPAATPRRGGLARSAFRAFVGYGISMAILAIVSLLSIPAMISASGPGAWGMIAAGQSIGGVGAVVIAYGWGLSGPAVIAQADPATRLREYVESVVAKFWLFIPVGIAVFCIAFLVGRQFAIYAGIAAIAQAAIGLLANWYFVGIAKPYALLALETVPRVLGTAISIVVMDLGSSALVGVIWQLIGVLAAFAVSSVWIIRPWDRAPLRAVQRRPLRTVLVSQRHGVTSTILSSVYSSAPIVIVALVAPAAQPVYAVVDKVQRQVIVALGPFVTVLQGWVPRAVGAALASRVRTALIFSSASALVLGALMALAAPLLVRWLGGNQIHPTLVTLILMAVLTAIAYLESVVSKACLAALRRINVVARSTAIGSAVGLPLVAIGAIFWGAPGAILGIVCGLTLRVILEWIGVARSMDDLQEQEPSVVDQAIVGVDE